LVKLAENINKYADIPLLALSPCQWNFGLVQVCFSLSHKILTNILLAVSPFTLQLLQKGVHC
jgi:hypothetical protein